MWWHVKSPLAFSLLRWFRRAGQTLIWLNHLFPCFINEWEKWVKDSTMLIGCVWRSKVDISESWGGGGSTKQGNREDSEGIKVNLDEVSHCRCDTWVVDEELVSQGKREARVCVRMSTKMILILKVECILYVWTVHRFGTCLRSLNIDGLNKNVDWLMVCYLLMHVCALLSLGELCRWKYSTSDWLLETISSVTWHLLAYHLLPPC